MNERKPLRVEGVYPTITRDYPIGSLRISDKDGTDPWANVFGWPVVYTAQKDSFFVFEVSIHRRQDEKWKDIVWLYKGDEVAIYNDVVKGPTSRQEVITSLCEIEQRLRPQTSSVSNVVAWWPLEKLLAAVRPGSRGDDWTWEDELEELKETENFSVISDDMSIREQEEPVLIGNDGRLWDGHHRVCAAIYLGLEEVLVEVVSPC